MFFNCRHFYRRLPISPSAFLLICLILSNLSNNVLGAEKASVKTSSEASSSAQSQTIIPINQISFLGVKLINQDLNSIRKHLWNVGGFLQAQSTVRQKNVDKFFPWSNLRDSYYIECHYDKKGKLVDLYRLFRPYSLSLHNKRAPLTTQEVARLIQQQVGPPTQVKTKSWGGVGSYRSYRWEDDKMIVIVDRQGSDPLGEVFVLYQIKTTINYLAYE